MLIHLEHPLDHIFHGAGIEKAPFRIIVCGSSDDDKFCVPIRCLPVTGCKEPQGLFRQILLQFLILDRTAAGIDQFRLGRCRGNSGDLMVLRQQHGKGEADIADSRNGDLHFAFLSSTLFCYFHGSTPIRSSG